ncbi:hypothetical protein [Parapedobacter pyrenivorans]|uniref:hypothetical protein n=1 Tax=Parapedobacter pyrenivorans TaxID=1305674 RepID=UPI0033428F73
MAPRAPHKPNRPSERIFKLLAIALPFCLLLVLEGLLNTFGYGSDLRLFVKGSDCSDCLVLNPHVSERYFTEKVNATIGNQDAFKKQKPPGTTRIFILGESTTVGFPYMHNVAFPRWLLYRLIQMYPAKRFEVINLALTAVNSYTVRDMAEELSAHAPDAVLIYAGHNEYYGALGVASTSRLGNHPLLVRTVIGLRRFRVVQLLFDLSAGIRELFKGKVTVEKNLMERMVRTPEIPIGSKRYHAAITQFEENIGAACRLLTQEGIPVFIGTVVSNERDLSPLDALHNPQAQQATTIYKSAMAAYEDQRFTAAGQLFVDAREQDMIRFRAPNRMNAIIRQFASTYGKVYVVESEALFRKHSPHGIIGKTTLLEHVHPNVKGYGLLAEAFFTTLSEQGILEETPVKELSFHQLMAEMPITKVDAIFGEYSVALLMQRWPFNNPEVSPAAPTSKEAELAYAMAYKQMPWKSAMENLMQYYQAQQDTLQALKVAESVMLEFPQDAIFFAVAGEIATLAKDYVKAINYLERAFAINKSLEIAQRLCDLHIRHDNPEKAIVYARYCAEMAPQQPYFRSAVVLLEQVAAARNPQGKLVDNNPTNETVARAYILLGYPDVANRYAQ